MILCRRLGLVGLGVEIDGDGAADGVPSEPQPASSRHATPRAAMRGMLSMLGDGLGYGRANPDIRRYVIRALLLAFCLAVSGCSSGGTPRDPTVDEVRAAGAAYLKAAGAELVSIMVEDRHVGFYVRGAPEWSVDRFVENLPLAAETARDMLARWPTIDDVDICGDGPWLPHPPGTEFVPASRVQVFRDRLERLPERLARPEDVMRAGGTDRSLDYYLDQRIVSTSAAYKRAIRANLPEPSRGPL